MPTFPNATVIRSDLEWRYGAALTAGDEENLANVRTEARVGMPFRVPVPGVFVDSMMPLQAAGRVRRVRVDGGEVLKGIRFLSTPGNSIDQRRHIDHLAGNESDLRWRRDAPSL